jgi:hypothetical protein
MECSIVSIFRQVIQQLRGSIFLTLQKNMFDFEIKPTGRLSQELLSRGIKTFASACQYVRALPYGRNSSRSNRLLVLTEKKGTCSGKHALLAELASEQEKPVELVLGIFRMTGQTTPPVQSILEQYELDYLPELHTYLRIDGSRLDFTGPENPIEPIFEFLVEKTIQPNDVETLKTNFHKDFLEDWLRSEGLDDRFDLESIWNIREECIAARSHASRSATQNK